MSVNCDSIENEGFLNSDGDEDYELYQTVWRNLVEIEFQASLGDLEEGQAGGKQNGWKKVCH